MSKWTVDTLKEFTEQRIEDNDVRYEQRFESQEKAVSAALQAAKEAVSKAETAAEKRFDSVNEFRGQLADQARAFMPRAEAELQFDAIAEKINNIQGLLGSIGGRSQGISAAVGYLVAAVSAFALLVTIGIAIATH
jgi:CHASE3 domain sensor protein